jgi:succinate dehydrogenase / fumarate reductase cytochrome b subunit
LGLVFFTITHLLGNLLLYKKDPTVFNAYAAKLESLGLLLEILEIGLLLAIAVHIITAITLKKSNTQARPVGYSMTKSKGGPSRSNSSSKNMIITGSLLLAFLILHLWQFKFAGAATTPEMKENLYQMVYTTFKNPVYVLIYVFCMILLGAHLRHGFWSAFQSLGAVNPKLDKPLTFLGYFIALLLTVGFLGIPLWLYFDLPGGLQ